MNTIRFLAALSLLVLAGCQTRTEPNPDAKTMPDDPGEFVFVESGEYSDADIQNAERLLAREREFKSSKPSSLQLKAHREEVEQLLSRNGAASLDLFIHRQRTILRNADRKKQLILHQHKTHNFNRAKEEKIAGLKISLASFHKVEMGMDLSSVVSIIGKPDSDSYSEFEKSGVNIVDLVWTNDVGNCSIRFENGKVISKKQSNLQ